MNKLYQRRHLRFNEDKKVDTVHVSDCGYHDFNYLKSNKSMYVQSGSTLHFVERGSGTLHVLDKTFEVSKGDFFFLPPNVEIMYYPSDSDPWAYYWFFIAGTGGEELGHRMGFSLDNPVRRATNTGEIENMMESLFLQGFSNEERYFNALSTLYAIASKLAVSQGEAQFVCNADTAQKVKEVIKLNYKDKDFRIEHVADMIFVSHSYMCKLFKMKTGISPVKYLVKLRLNKASELLKTKDYSVKKLCHEVGFNDELHFMKEFKKEFGVTVKEYREKVSKKSDGE
ncbi:MAG: AraC family transcriptional regulator [Clostridia bacterium]|nr:AraC family transcriptional regulator [Clostridia bacterium]